MAAIWIVFGHSVVISKNEVVSGYPGFEPGTLGSHTRTLTTAPPPLLNECTCLPPVFARSTFLILRVTDFHPHSRMLVQGWLSCPVDRVGVSG